MQAAVGLYDAISAHLLAPHAMETREDLVGKLGTFFHPPRRSQHKNGFQLLIARLRCAGVENSLFWNKRYIDIRENFMNQPPDLARGEIIWQRLCKHFENVPLATLAKSAVAISSAHPDHYDADQHWRDNIGAGESTKTDIALLAEEIDGADGSELNLGDALRITTIRAAAAGITSEVELDEGRRSGWSDRFWGHVAKVTGAPLSDLVSHLSPSRGKHCLECIAKLPDLRWTASADDYSMVRFQVRTILLEYLRILHEQRAKGSAAQLTFAKLWGPYTGPKAISEYANVVSLTEQGRQLFEVPAAWDVNANPNRQALFDDVMSWLQLRPRATQDPSDILRSVHAEGMWRGLSALGQAIANNFDCTSQQDPRRCLFLPMGEATIIAPKLGATLLTPERAGQLDILALLRHFYTRSYDTIEYRLPWTQQDNLKDVMHEIRIGMTQRSRILIIDGIESSAATPLDTLERFSSGNTMLGILSRIIDLPLAEMTPAQLQEYSNNRILLLTNRPLGSRPLGRSWSLPLSAAGPKGWEFSPPDNDAGDTIVKNHRLEHETEILSFRQKHREFQVLFDDLAYFALDSFFAGLERKLEEDADSITQLRDVITHRLSDSANEEPVYAIMLREFVEAWSKRSLLELKLLFIISLVPDGIRRSTLRRLSLSFLNLPQEFGLVSSDDIARYGEKIPGQLESPRVIDEAITNVLSDFPSLVVEGKGDYFPGFDGKSRGFEYTKTELDWLNQNDRNDDTVSISFVYPEFRMAVRDALAGQFGLKAFQLACRFLAFEAMDQQGIALRHEGIPEGQLMRPWRRQISMILFGLQSIPLDFLEEDNRQGQFAISDIYDRFTSEHPYQYATSQSFYRYIYHFAYRRQMERPPAYNVSRLYGMQSFKQELLRAFDAPWILLPPALVSVELSGASLFEAEFGDKQTDSPHAAQVKGRKRMLLAHYTSVLTTNLALGRIPNAETALTRMSNTVGILGLDSNLSILKRDLDICLARIDGTDRAFADFLKRADNVHGDNIQEATAKFLYEVLGREAVVCLEELLRAVIVEQLDFFATGIDQPKIAIDEQVATIIGIMGKSERQLSSSAHGISALADIIFRLAEFIAVRADHKDLNVVRAFDADAPPQIETEASINSLFAGREPDDRNSWILEFSRSLALFRIAEQFRLQSFRLDPASDRFFGSGHATRQMIRVALKLENHRRRTELYWGAAGSDGLFVRQARYGASVLSSHLFRYDRERAAMLLLEASMLRLLIRDPLASLAPDAQTNELELRLTSRWRALTTARSYLTEAEPALKALGHKSRWRMRLSLERSKIHRGLSRIALQRAKTKASTAKASGADKDCSELMQAKFYYNLSDLDVRMLEEASSSVHDYNLWRGISEHQAIRLDALRREIEEFSRQ